MAEIPNKDWYDNVSQQQKVATRCPFATVEACPRYFESLSQLTHTGATPMSQAEEERLKRKWKASDLWPRVGEQASTVFKAGDRLSFISNFCPEVTFERFGIFCTGLSAYSDGIDRNLAHKKLEEQSASNDDPRWQWARVEPQHYTNCKHYSVLHHRATIIDKKAEPWWREHLAKIIVAITSAIAGAAAVHFFK